jgi:hypothetical protein
MLILDYIFFKGLTEFVWYLIIAIGFVAWIASFVLKIYRIPLQVISVAALILGIYNLGMVHNEAKWEARMEEAKRLVEEADAEAEHANEKMVKENEDKRRIVEESGKKQAELASKLNNAVNNALANSQKTGQIPEAKEVIVNLSDEERKKYENMNTDQKKKYEEEISELLKNVKDCPVPKTIIDQINDSAKKPAVKGEQK